MTKQTISFLRAKYTPAPAHFTIVSAIRKGTLNGEKSGATWLIQESEYAVWFDGYPHKPGKKPEWTEKEILEREC